MKGKSIQEKYQILKILGHNVFSETFLAQDKSRFTRRRYIIKKFRPILGNPKVEEMRRMFYQEASILQRLSGENRQIPRLYEYFMDGEDFYLVREWIDGLTLKQKVEQQGKLPAEQVEDILKSILSFLRYIHSYDIVYRQLKPSTIVLRQNNWSFGNTGDYLPIPIYFGGVKELETINNPNQYIFAAAHQQQYIPPEQEQGKSVFASDLYSLGLTAIYLLTGKNPAEFPLHPQTNQLLWHREVSSPKIHLVRVIERAICPKISERYASAEEMLEALNSQTVSLALPAIPPSPKISFTSEVKIISLLSSAGIGVLGLTFLLLNLDLPQSNYSEAEQDVSAFQADTLLTDRSASLSAYRTDKLPEIETVPVFPLGMTQQSIVSLLGKPTINSRGYWQNSRALLYKDIIPQKIALGYLTDTDTTKVRQAEIAFANSVDLQTVKQKAKRLLQNSYSPEVDDYINQVYFKTSDRHSFSTSNFEGVVQRNPQEHIYIAIWEKGFHQ